MGRQGLHQALGHEVCKRAAGRVVHQGRGGLDHPAQGGRSSCYALQKLDVSLTKAAFTLQISAHTRSVLSEPNHAARWCFLFTLMPTFSSPIHSSWHLLSRTQAHACTCFARWVVVSSSCRHYRTLYTPCPVNMTPLAFECSLGKTTFECALDLHTCYMHTRTGPGRVFCGHGHL